MTVPSSSFFETHRKQRADAKRGYAAGQRDRETLQFQTPPPLISEEAKPEEPLKPTEPEQPTSSTQSEEHKETTKEQTDEPSSRSALMDSSEDDTAVASAGFTPKEF